MTQPRRDVFNPQESNLFHCMSRCVRRAFLCGEDRYAKRSFEHRRVWVKERLAHLVEIFAIELISYAVMENHLHKLIRNRPDIANSWSSEEVAKRWRRLFPKQPRRGGKVLESSEADIREITENPTLVERYRERLCSISWFNRCVCEYLARRANREDDCTGRFWEGRFKSQKIESIGGLIACSAYIDLNPIRARLAQTLDGSNFTSIQDRIFSLAGDGPPTSSPRAPTLISIESATNGHLTTDEYLAVVDSTGRIIREGKGRISPKTEEILVRLKVKPQTWIDSTVNFKRRFGRVVGPASSIRNAALKAGKLWFHGLRTAAHAFA